MTNLNKNNIIQARLDKYHYDKFMEIKSMILFDRQQGIYRTPSHIYSAKDEVTDSDVLRYIIRHFKFIDWYAIRVNWKGGIFMIQVLLSLILLVLVIAFFGDTLSAFLTDFGNNTVNILNSFPPFLHIGILIFMFVVAGFYAYAIAKRS